MSIAYQLESAIAVSNGTVKVGGSFRLRERFLYIYLTHTYIHRYNCIRIYVGMLTDNAPPANRDFPGSTWNKNIR